jgi:hypothetical protein
MARLNFVRGSIRGRVGQFVGSSWRGRDYIKTFTPPSNPKTAGQVAVRTIFLHVAHIAKGIYEGVLKPFTFPKPRRLTAYNRMVQINKELFDDLAWNPAGLKVFEGPLFNPGITAAAVSGTDVSVTFDGTAGEGTDKAIAVIHDELTETTLYGIATRTDAAITVSIAELDPGALTDLHAYLVFAQEPTPGTKEPGQVSNTAYKAVV